MHRWMMWGVVSDLGHSPWPLKGLWISRGCFPSLRCQRTQLFRQERKRKGTLSVFIPAHNENHTVTIAHTCWVAAVAFCSACVSRLWRRFIFSWFSAICLSYWTHSHANYSQAINRIIQQVSYILYNCFQKMRALQVQVCRKCEWTQLLIVTLLDY